MVLEEKGANVSDIGEEDKEPGEVMESAPPLKVGEEREFNSSSSDLKKKLLKRCLSLGNHEFGDEVAVHYVGTLLMDKSSIIPEIDTNISLSRLAMASASWF